MHHGQGRGKNSLCGEIPETFLNWTYFPSNRIMMIFFHKDHVCPMSQYRYVGINFQPYAVYKTDGNDSSGFQCNGHVVNIISYAFNGSEAYHFSNIFPALLVMLDVSCHLQHSWSKIQQLKFWEWMLVGNGSPLAGKHRSLMSPHRFVKSFKLIFFNLCGTKISKPMYAHKQCVCSWKCHKNDLFDHVLKFPRTNEVQREDKSMQHLACRFPCSEIDISLVQFSSLTSKVALPYFVAMHCCLCQHLFCEIRYLAATELMRRHSQRNAQCFVNAWIHIWRSRVGEIYRDILKEADFTWCFECHTTLLHVSVKMECTF